MQTPGPLAFFAESRLWTDRISVGIGARGFDAHGARVTHVATLTFEPIAEGDYIGDATLQLRKDEAQELIDALWRVGLRPSSGEGNVGQLGATEKHLADMRALVFKTEPLGKSTAPSDTRNAQGVAPRGEPPVTGG